MSSAQISTLVRYRYDALDRLVIYRLPNDSERQRYYCDSRLATETGDVEQLSIFQHVDQLLAQRHRHSAGIVSTLLGTDLKRSVLNALQLDLKQSVSYSVYGHRHLDSGLFSLSGFNGQRPEPVTGHYLLGNGYRAFNPLLMRFNSPDNLSPFEKGGLNAYAYCAADPVNRSDATGHFFSSIAKLFFRRNPRYVYDDATGVLGKSVESVTRISGGESGGILAITDKHNKGSRLTFVGHGSAGGQLIMRANGKKLSASDLIDLAVSKGIPVSEFDSYRLVMCYSASGGVNGVSFAENFHQIVGRPVKGYERVVLVPKRFLRFDLAVGETDKRLRYFGVRKRKLLSGEDSRREYRPVTFGATKGKNETIRR